MTYIQELERRIELLEGNNEELLKQLESSASEFLQFKKKIYLNDRETRSFKAAVENGKLDAVKFHIEQGADMSADNYEALRFAASYGYTEIVKYLLSQGDNLHNKCKLTIKYAANYGNKEIVDYVKSLGGSV